MITQSEVVDGDGRPGKKLLFHVNGKVVECRGDRLSQEWHEMLEFAGRDVTLPHAQKYPMTDLVPIRYAEIPDHHRKRIEEYFVELVSCMYDTERVSFHNIGTLDKSWCSDNDGR